ncbi:MAG: thiamine-phosphate kinase [Candidatus Margulisbacteria bacterium]|nr:thiamine-phosphate kinase [Candidatus Margulisiibacteriota bacterium]
MKLSQLGEFGLIDRIAKHEPKRPETIVGIGDDAAVLKFKSQKSKFKSNVLLITTDTLVENVHFKRKSISFHDLGYKALAVNISDIVAMGGWPTHALVTLGAPKNIPVKAIDELYRGINTLAKKHKIDIIGGDTVASPKEVIVSITLLGEVEKENLLLRSTAKEGDFICVTGEFGGPAAVHFTRYPLLVTRYQEARAIAKAKIASSMIDSSDGLVRSVLEICRASKVGARIYEDNVPIADGATLDQALYGGEEYELVFTVPADKLSVLKKLKLGVSIVGEIASRKAGVKLVDGKGNPKSLKSGGYEHFK